MSDRTVLEASAHAVHRETCQSSNKAACAGPSPRDWDMAAAVLRVAADWLRDLTADTRDKRERFMLDMIARVLTEGATDHE